ncbi:MAG: hypothetical protein ABS871_07030, partial [Methanobrevibacter sp.]
SQIADDAISESVLDDDAIVSSADSEAIPASEELLGNSTGDKIKTEVTATDIVADYKEGGNFVATLKDANGNAVNRAMITLKLGSITRVLYTDSNGQVSFNTDDLFPDTYPTTAVYSGDNTYEGSSAEAQVVINKLDTVLTAKYDYNSNNVVATVKDAKGRPVSGVIVGFERAGSRMLLATDQNGEARYYTGGLPKGYYSVDIKADANNIYKESNKITFNFTIGDRVKTKIFLRNALFFVTETKMVRVTLWDGNNNPIAGKTVHVKAYNSTWSGETDENGTAYIRVGIGFGVHDATVSFDGDDQYAPSERSGYIRVIKQTPSVMVRGADSIFKASDKTKVVKVLLRDRYDQPLPLDSKVVFKFNGKTYIGFTDFDGAALIEITANTPGVFYGQAMYGGNTAFNNVTRDIRIKITP